MAKVYLVTAVKETARHYRGSIDVTNHVTALRLREADGMILLERLDAAGDCIADTAHFSIGEAKSQAQFEYFVEFG